MIAVQGQTLFLRFVAPLVWRNERKIAAKLEGFAATEAGSALDMLKAAELTDDPHLRQLFFRHALDEARHAQLFRDAARGLGVEANGSRYNLIHATRQNLFERLGLIRFLAFVYLAERRGELQFRALRDHFAGERPELESLFARISKDEKFHVAYSRKLLGDARRDGRSREVTRALARVRFDRAREAWLRHGRMFGDFLSVFCLSVIYLVVLPLFAWTQRRLEPERRGWQSPTPRSGSITEARRQF